MTLLRLRAVARLLTLCCLAAFALSPQVAAAQGYLQANQVRLNGAALPTLLPSGQGIALANQYGSLQAAATASNQVQVGPSAPLSLTLPGAQGYDFSYDNRPPGSVQAQGTNVTDWRFGQQLHACWDPISNGLAGGYRDCSDEIGNFIHNYAAGEHPTTRTEVANAITGGWNTPYRKSTYSALTVAGKFYTPGQHTPFNLTMNDYAVGDTTGLNVSEACDGGANATADEGCEPFNMEAIYGNANYNTTVAAGATTGAATLALNAPNTSTGSPNTMGAGRYLMDVSKAASCSTSLTISSISGSGLTTMALSGTGCPVSTAQTTTTAAIANSNAAITVNMAVASSAGFTVGGVVVVADALSYETAAISAIPDATHITATLLKAHNAGAFLAQGGAAGYVVSLTADTFTAASYPAIYGIFSVPGPVPQAWPVVYSDATHLYVWIDGTSTYQPYVGSATLTGGANAFSLMPAAEVLDVSNGTGAPTNTFTLAPNAAPWAAGDTVNLPPYPYAKTNWGHFYYAKTYPTPSGQGGGFPSTYAGIWNGGDVLGGIQNLTPTSLYNQDGNTGKLSPPGAFNFTGLFGTGIVWDHAVYGGLMELKFDAQGGIGAPDGWLKADYATGGDSLFNDPPPQPPGSGRLRAGMAQ